MDKLEITGKMGDFNLLIPKMKSVPGKYRIKGIETVKAIVELYDIQIGEQNIMDFIDGAYNVKLTLEKVD